jgi:NitT/TauT family transport system substrate-binding protein
MYACRSLGLILGSLLLVAAGCARPATPTGGPASASSAPSQPAVSAPAPAAPAAAASAPAPLAPLSPAVPVRLGIKIGASMSDAGIYLAQDRGYFQEQGLDVDYINFDAGSRMIAPLAQDQIDVAAGATSAGLFNAWNRDIPIKVVADKGSQPPGNGYMALMVRKDLMDSGKIRDYADLRGLNIAIVATGQTDHHTMAMALAKGGLTLADANVIEMAFPDQIVGLRNASIDVALGIEPFISKMVDDGIAVRWHGSDEIYPEQLTAAVLYGPGFVPTEAARRWMIAYLKGVRDYNDAFKRNRGRDAVVDVLVKNIKGIDAPAYARIVAPGLDPNGKFSVAGVASDIRFYQDQGLLKQPIDAEQVVDLSFADYAASYLGPY